MQSSEIYVIHSLNKCLNLKIVLISTFMAIVFFNLGPLFPSMFGLRENGSVHSMSADLLLINK